MVKSEGEAVERMARWLDKDTDYYGDGSAWTEHDGGPWLLVAEGEDWPIAWNPFRSPTDERELLTAVQERWGRPSGDGFHKWRKFRQALVNAAPPAPDTFFGDALDRVLKGLAPGDIARAVDAVLREYGE